MLSQDAVTSAHSPIVEPRTLTVYDLDLVEYDDGLALQKAFELARRNGVVSDVLLLLEHPPTLTLGRRGTGEHIKVTREVLDAQGVRVFRTDRGGDVTYHGPGQQVGYAIIDLSPERRDVHRYMSDLEEVLIRTAADLGVKASRIPGWTGIWLGEKNRDARKLAAMGVHISRWVTTHGFALNVNTNLSQFDLIVPCGIAGAGVTSLERELGRPPTPKEVKALLARHMAERFNANLAAGPIDHYTVSVCVLRKRNNGLETLMLKRHARRGGFWQPVTGTVERNESTEQCAIRELAEETGINAQVRPLEYVHSFLFGEPRADRAPRIYQETAFWCLASPDASVKLDAREHVYFAWVSVDEAIQKVPFPGLKEALRRSLKMAQSA